MYSNLYFTSQLLSLIRCRPLIYRRFSMGFDHYSFFTSLSVEPTIHRISIEMRESPLENGSHEPNKQMERSGAVNPNRNINMKPKVSISIAKRYGVTTLKEYNTYETYSLDQSRTKEEIGNL